MRRRPRGDGLGRGGSVGQVTIVVVLLAIVSILNSSRAIGTGSPNPSSGGPGTSDAGGTGVAGTLGLFPSLVTSPAQSEQGSVRTTGVWYSELAYGQWVAGDIDSLHHINLPSGVIPLAGGSGLVVTGVRSQSSTDLVIWNVTTGRQLVAETVPFNVTGATVGIDASTVYLAGVTGDQALADAGVSALSLASGKLSQVLGASALRAEWQGNAARDVVISSNGGVLATALCGGPAGAEDSTCDISAIDLASGSVVGTVSTKGLYLAALTDTMIVTRSQFSVVAFEFRGNELWRFDAAEIRGPVAEAAGSVIVAYAPSGTVGPTRVAKLSENGAAQDLLIANGDSELSVWPRLSDAETVFVANAPPMEIAFGSVAGPITASAIDVPTSHVGYDSITITSGGQP